MEIDARGDVITVEEFWDCECDNDYIHRKSEESCPICKAHNEEMPDSRLTEILVEFGDKLDKQEREELVYFLYTELLRAEANLVHASVLLSEEIKNVTE